MKVGVFSDVHGNWEALTACLERFNQEKVQGYIYCGDLIGYGPDPEKCVQKVLSLPLLACVLGNHDAALMDPCIADFFNEDAKKALDINRSLLSVASIRSLSALAAVVKKPGYTVVHGTPLDPITEYFMNDRQFHNYYALWEGLVCFVGHIHLPFYMQGNESCCDIYVSDSPDITIKLDPAFRYVINPGAVGKPRDQKTQAAFGIWDTEVQTFRFLRQEYDYQLTQQKMKNQGFPPFLISTLGLGL